MLHYYALFLLIMNSLGFLTMWLDKRAARKGLRRIPEASLMAIALLCGCFGSYLGMRLCRHKTRHKLFSVGLPILMLIHPAIFVYTCLYFLS